MKRVKTWHFRNGKKTASKSDTVREDSRRKSKRNAGYKVIRNKERICTDHVQVLF